MSKLDRDWMTLPDGSKVPRKKWVVDLSAKPQSPNSEKLREAVKRFCRTEAAADNLVAYIQSHLNTKLVEIERCLDSIEWKDSEAVKGSIMWSQELGHKKAISKVRTLLREARER